MAVAQPLQNAPFGFAKGSYPFSASTGVEETSGRWIHHVVDYAIYQSEATALNNLRPNFPNFGEECNAIDERSKMEVILEMINSPEMRAVETDMNPTCATVPFKRIPREGHPPTPPAEQAANNIAAIAAEMEGEDEVAGAARRAAPAAGQPAAGQPARSEKRKADYVINEMGKKVMRRHNFTFYECMEGDVVVRKPRFRLFIQCLARTITDQDIGKTFAHDNVAGLGIHILLMDPSLTVEKAFYNIMQWFRNSNERYIEYTNNDAYYNYDKGCEQIKNITELVSLFSGDTLDVSELNLNKDQQLEIIRTKVVPHLSIAAFKKRCRDLGVGPGQSERLFRGHLDFVFPFCVTEVNLSEFNRQFWRRIFPWVTIKSFLQSRKGTAVNINQLEALLTGAWRSKICLSSAGQYADSELRKTVGKGEHVFQFLARLNEPARRLLAYKQNDISNHTKREFVEEVWNFRRECLSQLQANMYPDRVMPSSVRSVIEWYDAKIGKKSPFRGHYKKYSNISVFGNLVANQFNLFSTLFNVGAFAWLARAVYMATFDLFYDKPGTLRRNYFIVGPPGIGKSFLVKLVEMLMAPGTVMLMGVSSEKAGAGDRDAIVETNLLQVWDEFENYWLVPEHKQSPAQKAQMSMMLQCLSANQIHARRSKQDPKTNEYETTHTQIQKRNVMVACGTESLPKSPFKDRGTEVQLQENNTGEMNAFQLSAANNNQAVEINRNIWQSDAQFIQVVLKDFDKAMTVGAFPDFNYDMINMHLQVLAEALKEMDIRGRARVAAKAKAEYRNNIRYKSIRLACSSEISEMLGFGEDGAPLKYPYHIYMINEVFKHTGPDEEVSIASIMSALKEVDDSAEKNIIEQHYECLGGFSCLLVARWMHYTVHMRRIMHLIEGGKWEKMPVVPENFNRLAFTTHPLIPKGYKPKRQQPLDYANGHSTMNLNKPLRLGNGEMTGFTWGDLLEKCMPDVETDPNLRITDDERLAQASRRLDDLYVPCPPRHTFIANRSATTAGNNLVRTPNPPLYLANEVEFLEEEVPLPGNGKERRLNLNYIKLWGIETKQEFGKRCAEMIAGMIKDRNDRAPNRFKSYEPKQYMDILNELVHSERSFPKMPTVLKPITEYEFCKTIIDALTNMQPAPVQAPEPVNRQDLDDFDDDDIALGLVHEGTPRRDFSKRVVETSPSMIYRNGNLYMNVCVPGLLGLNISEIFLEKVQHKYTRARTIVLGIPDPKNERLVQTFDLKPNDKILKTVNPLAMTVEQNEMAMNLDDCVPMTGKEFDPYIRYERDLEEMMWEPWAAQQGFNPANYLPKRVDERIDELYRTHEFFNKKGQKNNYPWGVLPNKTQPGPATPKGTPRLPTPQHRSMRNEAMEVDHILGRVPLFDESALELEEGFATAGEDTEEE